jgi:uncharacterized glyoxalase superfamily protein PhnB
MDPRPKETRATIIPCLLYRDAAAAMKWLCDTFGFEKRVAYEGEGGAVMHAELSFGNGMIMLGTAGATPFGKLIKQPDEIGRLETQAPYVIVDDPDVVYERAKAAGAEIVIDIKTEESYDSRGFTCRDLEGHLWSFGTYDPWPKQ